MSGTSTWSDHLGLKLVNIATFLLFFGSGIYTSVAPGETGRETFFTPADWSLQLWGLINFLLAFYVVYQFFDASHDSIHAVGYRFALVGVLNSIFLTTFHTGHYITAFIFAILVNGSVSTIYYSLRLNYPAKSVSDKLVVHLPFSLWHAYSIFIVLLAAFTLFTGHTHGTGHPGFTVKLLVLIAEGFLAATAWGYALSSKEGDIAGSTVLVWFLFGIYSHQSNHTIRYFALGSAIFASFAVVKALIFTATAKDTSNLVTDAERAPLIG